MRYWGGIITALLSLSCLETNFLSCDKCTPEIIRLSPEEYYKKAIYNASRKERSKTHVLMKCLKYWNIARKSRKIMMQLIKDQITRHSSDYIILEIGNFGWGGYSGAAFYRKGDDSYINLAGDISRNAKKKRIKTTGIDKLLSDIEKMPPASGYVDPDRVDGNCFFVTIRTKKRTHVFAASYFMTIFSNKKAMSKTRRKQLEKEGGNTKKIINLLLLKIKRDLRIPI